MKQMFHRILVVVTLTCHMFVTGDLYSTCYEYETYCLFSFGPNVTVNNVKEAQNICEDARLGSWLLEFVDEKVLGNVKKFAANHSFPEDTKLILNAEKVGNTWKWIKNQKEIKVMAHFLEEIDGMKLFTPRKTGERINASDRFAIVCMTEPKLEESDLKEKPGHSKRFIALWIILPVLMISLILTSATLLWIRSRKKNLRKIRREDQKCRKPSNSSSSEIIEEGNSGNYVEVIQDTTNASGPSYVNISLPSKEIKSPVENIGPLGDVYSQVARE